MSRIKKICGGAAVVAFTAAGIAAPIAAAAAPAAAPVAMYHHGHKQGHVLADGQAPDMHFHG